MTLNAEIAFILCFFSNGFDRFSATLRRPLTKTEPLSNIFSTALMTLQLKHLPWLKWLKPLITYLESIQRICCSAWNNCSASVQRDNCTIYDLLTHVVQYSSWSQFYSYYYSYDVNQQRYNEAVDSVHHLCSNIEPGTNASHSVSSY